MNKLYPELELIKDILISNSQTLSVAESVTGGSIRLFYNIQPVFIKEYLMILKIDYRGYQIAVAKTLSE